MSDHYTAQKFEQKRKRSGVVLSCQTCAREFYIPPSRARQAERNGCAVRFCSNACYVKTGDKNPFYGGKHKADSIKKMKEHPNRQSFKTGPENPNFVRFGADYKPRTSIHLRSKLIERSGGKCERCANERTGILQIHHVDRNRRHNAMSNLLLLCPNCHAIDHYEANDGMFSRLIKSEQGSFP